MGVKTNDMKSSHRPKVNPRKIPRSQEDVEKAWENGVLVGVSNATAIFLTVCADKFGMADQMFPLWTEINKLSEEVLERRVSVADLKYTLKKEYGIRL